MVFGQDLLHVQGTPYEMGYQHGVALKDKIWKNVNQFIYRVPAGAEERKKAFLSQMETLCQLTPPEFLEEIRGVSDGSGIPYQDLLVLNLFPEMFHCSGITAHQTATVDGKLYHVRVLDYSIGKGIQDTAVLIVASPDQKIPFVNFSYAGFIGSVTGVNREGIAVGEIGGQGYGDWNGIPMAFLMRMMLEQAHSLEEAQTILQNSPRTCEYYYVLSDGKQDRSIGVYATRKEIHFIQEGTAYTMFSCGENFLPTCEVIHTPFQTQLLREDHTPIALTYQQPPHCILMTGFSRPKQYQWLAERIDAFMGFLDVPTLMQIIRRPIARETNLHNAIFSPQEQKMWVSHMGSEGEPACDQPYEEFDLNVLFDDGDAVHKLNN